MTAVSDALSAARPGSRVDGSIPVGNMASGSPLAIPFVACWWMLVGIGTSVWPAPHRRGWVYTLLAAGALMLALVNGTYLFRMS